MRVIDAVWGFFAVYVVAFGVLMVLLLAIGEDQVTAFSAIAACMTNTGTGLGEVAQNFTSLTRYRQMDLRARDAARPPRSLPAAGAGLADVLAQIRALDCLEPQRSTLRLNTVVCATVLPELRALSPHAMNLSDGPV